MEKIVFTNGCFDILHPGHVDLLTRARALGTRLIVGINSDRSVRAIKGEGRPLQDEDARKAVLLGLKPVDEVLIFDELTPQNLIEQIKPNVLVKGGDWKETEIIGADYVKANGGEVFSLPLVGGFSTSEIAGRMQKRPNDVASGETVIELSLNEHLDEFRALLASHTENIADCAKIIVETAKAGKKVLLCGNGRSAADAQHIAAEFVGRYETEQRAAAGDRPYNRHVGTYGPGQRLFVRTGFFASSRGTRIGRRSADRDQHEWKFAKRDRGGNGSDGEEAARLWE